MILPFKHSFDDDDHDHDKDDFKDYKKLGQVQIPLSAAFKRATKYTDASLSSYYRFQKESWEAPNTRRQWIDKIVPDEFDIHCPRIESEPHMSRTFKTRFMLEPLAVRVHNGCSNKTVNTITY